MKYSRVFQLAVVVSLALAQQTPETQQTLAPETNADLICSPADPLDCYPRIFEPTDDWQTIKPGQDIPGGLHVRLNIETGEKEAKNLHEDTDESSLAEDSALIAVEQPEAHQNEQNHQNEPENDIEAQILHKIQKHKQEQAKMKNSVAKTRVTLGDVRQFDAAVEEIRFADETKDLNKVSLALDTLEELSHDIEFGERLAQGELFGDLIQLKHTLAAKSANSADSADASEFAHTMAEIEDKAYRVMAGALRNNPEAVSAVLVADFSDSGDSGDSKTVGFVEALFAELHKSAASNSPSKDTFEKRILGVISALTHDPIFQTKHFSSAMEELVGLFPTLGPQAQARLMNILEDNGIYVKSLTNSNLKRSVEDSTFPDAKYSDLLQQKLVAGNISEQKLQAYFDNLCQVHGANKNLVPLPDFIEWLAREAASRNSPEDKRELSSQDRAFDRKMLEARHLVFGNPNAMRKAQAIYDEL